MEYFATGVMSGTSLDGMDIACCAFSRKGKSWSFRILRAETIPYPSHWVEKLQEAPLLSGRQLIALHNEYGQYIGETLKRFFKTYKISNAGIISSHGHTVFHQPGQGYTFQIGNGAAIAAQTGLTVVSELRNLDVALGGQGAPLVPIGDKLLFHSYDYCLNLGGFANISFEGLSQRLAFDICPVNFVFNRLVSETKIPADKYGVSVPEPFLQYDPEGMIARRGKIIKTLLEKLNALPFYQTNGPKSLGEEWVNRHIWPIIKTESHPLENLLRTYCEHVAMQIRESILPRQGQKMLATGGGVRNVFLMERISAHLKPEVEVVIPGNEIVDFKEALVFAFLGVLRQLDEPNCLASVTGSRYNNTGGAVFNGKA